MEPSTQFTIRPLSDSFGVELSGVDLATCGPETHRSVVELFDRHGVMVIRDQLLSPEAQLRFTRALALRRTIPAKNSPIPTFRRFM